MTGELLGEIYSDPIEHDNQLSIQAGKMNAVLYHVSETLFRHPEAPLTFEFIDDGKDSIVKLIVRENGTIVEEANRL